VAGRKFYPERKLPQTFYTLKGEEEGEVVKEQDDDDLAEDG